TDLGLIDPSIPPSNDNLPLQTQLLQTHMTTITALVHLLSIYLIYTTKKLVNPNEQSNILPITSLPILSLYYPEDTFDIINLPQLAGLLLYDYQHSNTLCDMRRIPTVYPTTRGISTETYQLQTTYNKYLILRNSPEEDRLVYTSSGDIIQLI